MSRLWLYAGLILLMSACISSPQEPEALGPTSTQPVLPTATLPPQTMTEAFTLTSPSFVEGDTIPDRFACTGANLSPELQWSGVPEGTQSFVLIFDDPDAPGGGWVHWVIYGIPANANSLPEAVPGIPILDDGTAHGANSWGTLEYGGPCPPQGSTHRYVFTLYALDLSLESEPGASKSGLITSMEGHILGQAQLTGTFGR